MEIIYPVIFPELTGRKAGSIDMAAEVLKTHRPRDISPFLDPDFKNRFLARYAYRNKIDYSWGGYLEDRREALKGSYLHPDHAVHLGVDLWVRAGTTLSVARPCHLVHQTHDMDQNGGWGGVMFLELDQPVGNISHVLYAHLAKTDKPLALGHAIKPGDTVGILGAVDENGGWPEHLHVQAMTIEAWETTRGDLTKFDGYGTKADARLFPDPKILF